MGNILQIKNLTKKFGGLTAVNDMSFELKRGELLGLIGPNGAGKTTLFNLISGFETASTGSIWFNGINITNKKPHKIVNLGIARTFQVVRPLKTLSLLDNVIIGCMSPRSKKMQHLETLEQQASTILTNVGLIDKARIPPIILPHGDLKRLEFARALSTNPELLLLDEPFSGLSRDEQTGIVSLILKLNDQGFTIIIVGHVLRELMAIVPRVIVMDQGKLIADGTPKEVTQEKRVYEAYLGTKEN